MVIAHCLSHSKHPAYACNILLRKLLYTLAPFAFAFAIQVMLANVCSEKVTFEILQLLNVV